MLCCFIESLNAQSTMGTFRIGISTSVDGNLSSKNMGIDTYSGYSVKNDKFNYRLGLNFEYELNERFAINSTINYSVKDFTGTFYCSNCEFFVPPFPEDMNFRFIEIPVSLKYYFLENKNRFFGKIGINNQFLLKESYTEYTAKNYSLGIILGGGFEYNILNKLALQIFIDYNHGITSVFKESDFKLNYLGFGASIIQNL